MVPLTQLINQMVAGKLVGSSSLWMQSRLVPLTKPDSDDIRPIAVGEALTRCCQRLVSTKVGKQIGESLQPLQFGVGVSGGCEYVIHRSQIIVEKLKLLQWTMDMWRNRQHM